ncbi:MAG: hypothetical protein B6D41_22540 [Chloroflexi bacterium UTCFX4]|nr:MAG: hypothetical protein B6D41_22540 [Chloroflexi bacterium UTCFX4]
MPIDLNRLRVLRIYPMESNCDGQLILAPDENRYLCIQQNGSQIEFWLGTLHAGIERKLVMGGECPQWTADSQYILYGRRLPQFKAYNCTDRFYQMNVNTGIEINLNTHISNLRMLSNGDVLYESLGELYVYDPRSQKRLGPFLGTSGELSPDGQHFAGAIVREEYAKGILIADADERNIFSRSDGEYSGSKPFAWSPDGKQLAFSFTPEETRRAELWLVNADGTNPLKIWEERYARFFRFLQWMPDGRTLLFVTDGGGTSFDEGYTYKAIDTVNRNVKELFQHGNGLRVSKSGHTLWFWRDKQGPYIAELEW